MKTLVSIIVAAGALLCVAAAYAAPPVLLSVSQIDRHPTANWTLSPGAEARVVEVATSPMQASDGYFFTENIVAFSAVESGDTSWIYGSQLDPGTYYVHVASYQPDCYECPTREWSNIGELTIPGAGSTSTPAPATTPSTTTSETTPTSGLTGPEQNWLRKLSRFATKIGRAAERNGQGRFSALATFATCSATLTTNVGAPPTNRLGRVYRPTMEACKRFEAGVRHVNHADTDGP